MENTKFICFANGIAQFDYKGASMGIGDDRALYYSKSLGRHRIYRSTYPMPPKNPINDFALLSFSNEEDAKMICDIINEANKDVFVPLAI